MQKFSKINQDILKALPVTMKGHVAIGRMKADYTFEYAPITIPAGTIVVLMGYGQAESNRGQLLLGITKDLVPAGKRQWENWGNMCSMPKDQVEIFTRADIDVYK